MKRQSREKNLLYVEGLTMTYNKPLLVYVYIYIAWNRGYIQAVPMIKTERTNIR